MKSFVSSVMAATLITAPMLAAAPVAAQSHTTVVRKNNGHTVVTKSTSRPVSYRSWRRGQRFDRRYAGNYRVVDNYRTYRLSAPPRGYHWVRSGDDAVLVGIATGVIASVLANRIR